MVIVDDAGVLVRVSGPDPQGLKAEGRAFYSMESGRTTLSASGFACESSLAKGEVVVVTSASVLAPFIKLERLTDEPLDELVPGCEVDVHFESGRWHSCRLIRIARARKVVEAAESLTGTRVKAQRGIHAGCVALLALQGEDVPRISSLRAAYSRPARGDGIVISSAPFGLVSPAVFQNSVTTGIVSNVVRSPPSAQIACLYLTDARCLPGAEGGAAFNAAGHLIGMVAPPFQRQDQSVVELGSIIPLTLFAHSLGLQFDQQTHNKPPLGHLSVSGASASGAVMGVGSALGGSRSMTVPPPGLVVEAPAVGPVERSRDLSEVAIKAAHKTVASAARSVVLICVNASWGSGIVVSDEGHILTCAHLFRPFAELDKHTGRLRLRHEGTLITVAFRDDPLGANDRCLAELLFCSNGPIDIALLKLCPPSKRGLAVEAAKQPLFPVQVSWDHPRPGQACVALGHAIFDPTTQLGATVSAGVVSKVVGHPRDPSTPAILQTCASVFRGHSGGLLADADGRLLGVLTSNARHSNGSIIPSINFSVPVAMLRPLLEAIPLGDKVQDYVFSAYDRDDAELLSLWRLESSPSPAPRPKIPGSRFSEFLDQFASKL